MSERRFTEKPDLDPVAVRSLPDGHPAMVENRTLFPSTVVEVTANAPDRLLVSGENNIKIGKTVEKGEFNGYGIFMLSLEERATCPTDCAVRGYCYGNGMQMARRHRIGDPDVFFDRLGLEIAELLDEHEGLLIRLHVLGDFPSVEYVSFWKEVLDEYPNVACFGYTHRATTRWGGDEIGEAIAQVKSAHPKRFRIRWSSPTDRADGATVIDYIPEGSHSKSGALVCPSQLDNTACCATCALCWERGFADKTIAFIKHGPKSDAVAAEAYMQQMDPETPETAWEIASNTSNPVALTVDPDQGSPVDLKVNFGPADVARRRVRSIQLPQSIRDGYAKTFMPQPPEVRLVVPSTLIVEVGYQRDLSGKSLRLIKNIVANWDWAKFKPPVCAETPDGLFVIDGQHTAIAAASHPKVEKIPVMIVSRPDIEDRAAAFVSQNQNRLSMSPLQIFHAQLVAGDKDALGILRCVVKAGATVPRSPPLKGKEKAGELATVTPLYRMFKARGADHVERVVHIAVLSGRAPITSTILYGLDIALTMEPANDDYVTSELTDEEIAYTLARIDVEKEAAAEAAANDISRYHALAGIIEHNIWHVNSEVFGALKAAE
jgi:hypothetical protein